LPLDGGGSAGNPGLSADAVTHLLYVFLYQPSTKIYSGLQDIDYPLHDKTIVVTCCGRICLGEKKINFSTVFAGQAVGIKEVHDDIRLVSFMNYDLGYFGLETRVLEPLENPFGPKVLPMS
jgi:putative transposase